jgi:hypothetical protein
MELTINGSPQTLRSNELLIEVINRGDVKIPQVCYHPQLAPKQKQLHNLGAFEVLRGALSSSDKLIEITVDAAKSDASVRAVRNAIILGKMLGSINPEALREVAIGAGEPFGCSGIKSSCAEVATRHGSTARRSRWR